MTVMRLPYLHGFFGAPNFGDELLCRSIAETFGGDEGTIVATRSAAVTKYTMRGVPGVSIVPGMLFNLAFFGWLPLRVRKLGQASNVLIGGGGLLQDTYSTATLMRSTFDAAWAVRFGIPFDLIGIELGSIYHPESKSRARFLLRHARSVWCRDPESARRAGNASHRDDVREVPDLAHDFLRRWFAAHPRQGGGGHCVFNPLSTPGKRPEEFAALVRRLCRDFSKVTLAAAQPGEEKAWLEMIGKRPSNLEIFSSGDWKAPLELLRGADALIAERFHFLAAGAHAGLRVVPIVPTAKARHLAESLGIGDISLSSDDFTASAVVARLDRARAVDDGVLSKHADGLSVIRDELKAAPAVRYDAAARSEAWKWIQEILRQGAAQKFNAVRKRVAGTR